MDVNAREYIFYIFTYFYIYILLHLGENSFWSYSKLQDHNADQEILDKALKNYFKPVGQETVLHWWLTLQKPKRRRRLDVCMSL